MTSADKTVAEIVTASVAFPGEQATLNGFLARPSGNGSFPAVVIIHEWWGLSDHIKDIAQRFAREGFVALALDCYSRLGYTVTKDPAEAAKWMEQVQSQQVLKDLNATTQYLKTLPFVDAWKLAVAGFCMGGTFALMAAAHNSDFKASVPFYGQIPPSDSLKYLICPVLFIHGASDTWILKRDVERLGQAMKQYGKTGEVHSYPNCGHAFFNDTRPEAYRPAEAQDAWQRVLAFLRQQLR